MYDSRIGFDSILVRLKEKKIKTTAPTEEGFDSILVRLKGFIRAIITTYRFGFDSILVRLKERPKTG